MCTDAAPLADTIVAHDFRLSRLCPITLFRHAISIAHCSVSPDDLHVQLAVLLKGTPIRLPEPSELFNPTAIPIKTPSILMSSLQPLDPSMKVGPSQSYLKHQRSSHLYQGVLTKGKYNTKKPAPLKNLILITTLLLNALNFNPDGHGSICKRHQKQLAYIRLS